MINTIKKHKHRIALAAVIFFFAGIAVSKNYIVKEYVKNVLADMTDETQSIPTPTDTPTDTITPTDTVTPTDTPTDSPTPSDVSGAGDEVVSPTNVPSPTATLTQDQLDALKAQKDAADAQAQAQADADAAAKKTQAQNDYMTHYATLSARTKVQTDKSFISTASKSVQLLTQARDELQAAMSESGNTHLDNASAYLNIVDNSFASQPYPAQYASFMQSLSAAYTDLDNSAHSLRANDNASAQTQLSAGNSELSGLADAAQALQP